MPAAGTPHVDPHVAGPRIAALLRGHKTVGGAYVVPQNVLDEIGTALGATGGQFTAFKLPSWVPGYGNASVVSNPVKPGIGAVGTAAGTIATGAASSAVSAVGQVIGQVTGLSGVLGFIGSLSNWARLGEVILGAALVLLGLRAMTGGSGDPIELVRKLARAA